MQNICELERLAMSPQLVVGMSYDNPNRDKQKFYDFVRGYANQQGMMINEIQFSLPQDLDRSFYNIGTLSTNTDISKFDKAVVIAEDISRILMMPLFYPIFGGGWSMRVSDNSVDIAVPQWDGIKPLFLDYKVHEYFHAYNAIVANDLRSRGLISVDGFYDIPNEAFTPITKKAPNEEELKRFERTMLSHIIRMQKKLGL